MEIQVVDEIFDHEAAATMGLKLGGYCYYYLLFYLLCLMMIFFRVCVMIHSGSRGLGHQVCTDYLQQMQQEADNLVHPNDRQLTGVKVYSHSS